MAQIIYEFPSSSFFPSMNWLPVRHSGWQLTWDLPSLLSCSLNPMIPSFLIYLLILVEHISSIFLKEGDIGKAESEEVVPGSHDELVPRGIQSELGEILGSRIGEVRDPGLQVCKGHGGVFPQGTQLLLTAGFTGDILGAREVAQQQREAGRQQGDSQGPQDHHGESLCSPSSWL